MMTIRPQHRRWHGMLFVLVAPLVLGPAGAVRGEDSIFEAIADVINLFAVPEPADADAAAVELAPILVDGQNEGVNIDFVGQFRHPLTRVLDVELHFAHKVCRFDAEQLATLKQVGRAEVEKLSMQHARPLNKGNVRLRMNGGFVLRARNNRNAFGAMDGAEEMGMIGGAPGANQTDARKRLTDALEQKIDELASADVAQQYRQELAARENAKREAAREMMTMLIDRRLTLSPQQYDAVGAAIDQRWDEAWPTNMQAYLYEDFAPMPQANVLRPHLTARQRALWQGRINQGVMSFGWEQNLGLMMPWGEIDNEFLILEAGE